MLCIKQRLFLNCCPYAGDIFTFKTVLQRTSVWYTLEIEIKYPAFEFSLTKYPYYLLSLCTFCHPFHNLSIGFLIFFSRLTRTVTNGPNGRADRPWAALSGHGGRLGRRRACCRALALLLSGCCGAR